MSNEDKIMSMLVSLSTDLLDFRKEVKDKFEAQDKRFNDIDSKLEAHDKRFDELSNQIEDIEVKNIERHKEMERLITANATNISKLQKVK